MNTEYIVMTASAKMPSSCKGNYRRVAVVEVEKGVIPAMISDRAKGLVRIVETWEGRNVGKTEKSAYWIAMAEAKAMAKRLSAV